MPVVVRLQYCVIHMYFDDHNPPHFHIYTPDMGAVMDLRTFEVIEGSVDRRAEAEARDWAKANVDRLWGLWEEYSR
jgi:hypothetical protein